MNKVTLEAVKPLMQPDGDIVLSFYLPTHKFPTSEHIAEDRIRFKNLVRASQDALASAGASEELAMQMAGQLETDIYDNDEFWQRTTEGLAVFCAPSGVKYFNLPIECGEYMVVGDSYDVTPLLALVSHDQPYYVLALATQQPMLYRGDMYGVEAVDVELPESPEIALNIDESHAHSKTDRSKGSPGTKAHGQGDSHQAGQEERLKFFRMVDDAVLSSDLVDNSLPFVLAGTDDEIGAYREVTKIRIALEQVVSGNQTTSVGARAHEVHERSWPIVQEEVVESRHQAEIEKVRAMLGTGKASADIDDIQQAAQDGRVDSLLVGLITMTRDVVNDSDEVSMKMVLSQDYMKTGVGLCGHRVVSQGGKVVGLRADELPGESGVAALYRY